MSQESEPTIEIPLSRPGRAPIRVRAGVLRCAGGDLEVHVWQPATGAARHVRLSVVLRGADGEPVARDLGVVSAASFLELVARVEALVGPGTDGQ